MKFSGEGNSHAREFFLGIASNLGLKRGDTVVDIGCGTGLNFPLLYRAVGPQGLIIGVDLSDAMLAQARLAAEANHWATK